jgi:hypothetical protein
VIKQQDLKAKIVRFDFMKQPVFPKHQNCKIMYFMHYIEKDDE